MGIATGDNGRQSSRIDDPSPHRMHSPHFPGRLGVLALVLVTVLLAPIACSKGDGGPGEVFGSPVPTSAPATTTTTTPATQPPRPTTTTTAPAPKTPTLDPDGVGLAPFGTPMADVAARLTASLGTPTEALATSACAPGMSSAAWGSFSVWSQEGSFAGYYYKNELPGTPTLMTSRGIGLGSTSQQVTDAYGADASVVPDDYGHHWEVGGPSGLQIYLDGSGPSATVRQLVGGGLSPCD